jgi:hypothetical protein
LSIFFILILEILSRATLAIRVGSASLEFLVTWVTEDWMDNTEGSDSTDPKENLAWWEWWDFLGNKGPKVFPDLEDDRDFQDSPEIPELVAWTVTMEETDARVNKVISDREALPKDREVEIREMLDYLDP